MLFPKKVKHRKWQTGRKSPSRLARPDTRGTRLAFGSYALKATMPSRLTSNQIEAARKVLTRSTAKGGKLWIRVFPDWPITGKPAEVGMGSGKGDLKHFVFQVRPGRILFELDGVPEASAREYLRQAGAKLPMKTVIIARD
ncbi:50S ribosomal protein L16 [Candidatus Kaiserbacteria bacterium RIFCSPLOWO2_02_FULL_56_11]|uniref:Large ribosomal subunit protein uL16 n=2 Tax=Candidatus Kaiseribacteriota TaxID=1752734 RepID=A0A1F6E2A4_9BACT|nr:MAG: 50S ribosomal protein L16 [Candidatus Kaiserbacteria bacterium RIFCSPHIGHO2_02_FULL_56_30]OGG72415.1 MAG: 50S ribosomal protein L16 [Candidatus Kaiserbacteria bacterium RIFCSPHIGHO2_12_FULL_56_13]OGG82282.1 MAG: 50S ribosomal protein L16 [Candidatus Kaiserbacteria bacterium RIFCSPLOWO2_02_FULL_56_11]